MDIPVYFLLGTRINNLRATKTYHVLFYNSLLKTHGLDKRQFMFFPSNFLPNKNHRMLLTAYNIFTARNPKSRLDLVLTGSYMQKGNSLRNDINKMGLMNRVHLIRTDNKHNLAALWQGCSSLIFPSLEETNCHFLIRAMFFNKPILCSNIDPFLKYFGKAALYFDPRNPNDIAHRIGIIAKEENLRSALVKRLKERRRKILINEFCRRIGKSIKNIFSVPQKINTGCITGIHEDKWTGPEIIVFFKSGLWNRHIEFHFDAPSHLPAELMIQWKINNRLLQEQTLARGDDILIRQVLPKRAGYLTVWIHPVFRPSNITAGSSDHRFIGCLCHGCWIVTDNEKRIPLISQDSN